MKRMAAIVIVLCLLFPAASFSAFAAEEGSQQAYAPVIDEYAYAISLGEEACNRAAEFTYVGSVGFGGYHPGTGTVYAFYDVNGDGTEEMLVGTGSASGMRSIIELFYLQDGQIEKLFGETFNYRVGLHIGADGTVMQEGSDSAWSGSMTIYSVSDLSAPVTTAEYYYDTSGERPAEGVWLSEGEYTSTLTGYVNTGLDYTSLDWHFFVTPPEGEYDPYPPTSLAPTLSGLYTEDAGRGSQFLFCAEDSSFIFTVNTMEGYETYSGDYMVTDAHNGTVYCNITKRSCVVGSAFNTSPFDLTGISLTAGGGQIRLLHQAFSVQENETFTYAGEVPITLEYAAATVTGDAVRIRCGPGTEYTDVWQFDSGTPVTVTGRSGDWYRVDYSVDDLTMTGFMSAQYVSVNS